MQADLLNTNEVLARGSVGGDGGGQFAEVEVGETEGVEGGTPLGNL